MQLSIPRQQARPPQPALPIGSEQAFDRVRTPAASAGDEGRGARSNESTVKLRGLIAEFGSDVRRPAVDWDWGPEAERRNR